MDISNFSPTKYRKGNTVRMGYLESTISPKVELGLTEKNELKIGFGSDILGPNYFDCINSSNLSYCLREVLNTGACSFDIDEVIKNGYSYHIHVTEDIDMQIDRDDYKDIHSLLKKPNKWTLLPNNNSLGWANKMYRMKEQIKMYGKYHQMTSLKDRKEFMAEHNIDPAIFEGKLRIEHKLQNAQVIRKRLKLSDNKITSIFAVDSSPTVAMIKHMFDMSYESRFMKASKGIKDAERRALMQVNGFDWNKIEAQLRSFDKNATQRSIPIYKHLHEEYWNQKNRKNGKANGVDLLNDIVKEVNLRWEYSYDFSFAAAA